MPHLRFVAWSVHLALVQSELRHIAVNLPAAAVTAASFPKRIFGDVIFQAAFMRIARALVEGKIGAEAEAMTF